MGSSVEGSSLPLWERWLLRFSGNPGRAGEGAAARHLRRRGYRILCRNFRTKGGEVDILAEKDGAPVAVEVKTRLGGRFGAPEEAVTHEKARRVKRAAVAYCRWHGLSVERLRMDVVALEREGDSIRIRHHENAVEV